jgi:hypothetical protein
LAGLLGRGLPPEGFRPDAWHVIWADPHSVVLGDGCVLARLEDGRLGSLLKDSKTWCEAYLPISDRQVLVATRGQVRPSLTDAMSIYRASAAFALEYIYASCAGPAACDLVPLIGTCEPLLSKDELTEIVSQGFGST